MKNSFWIIVFSGIIFVCIIIWLAVTSISYPIKTVGIYQNGTLVEKINLDTVTSQREIVLSGDYGKNVIVVNKDYIKMKSADCPDKICVKHGALTESTTPIVCLPNKVIVKFENSKSDDIDAKAGVKE